MGCCSPNRQKLANEEENKIEVNYDSKKPVKESDNINDHNSNNSENISNIQTDKKEEENKEKLKNKLDNNSIISSHKSIQTQKIEDSEYQNILEIYPPLTNEDNDKLEVKKNLIFEDKTVYFGEYNNEKKIKEGRGIQIWPNGSKYFGYFQNNMQNIKGKMEHADGDIYEGEWLNDRANGKGKYTHKGITYEGNWKNDKQEGYGVETWNDGSIYEGYFVNGKKEGKGKYIWPDKSSYEGDFKDNAFNGKGKFIWGNKREYDGDWENNRMKGNGIFTWPDGRKSK